MPVEISLRSNLKQVSKQLSALAYKQVDFAASQAINDLAKQVAKAEQENIKATFEKPKPFTVSSVAVKGSTKRSLTAVVYVKPIAAKYLAPYEDGGTHKLPGRALLNPKNIRLDQYGQLTRATLARLKSRRDVFIGPVNTKHGVINGVWQRPYIRQKQKVRGQSRGQGLMARGANTTGRLILLIRFGDALPVKKRLGYGTKAKSVLDQGWNAAFQRAMAKALATAR